MARRTHYQGRRPICGMSPDSYRAHILQWRRIGAGDDWVCDICDKRDHE